MSDAEVSALIIPAPEADAVVGPFRVALDSAAVLGVPAHITILYPFMPTSLLTDDIDSELRDLFATVDVFETSLASIERFGHDVVYIRPEPTIRPRIGTRFGGCGFTLPLGGSRGVPGRVSCLVGFGGP